MTEPEVVKALAALAQETRLRVFRLLVVAGAQGLMPTQIAEQLGVPPTALSFHLKELSHAGLVAAERNGRTLIYRAQFAHMNHLLGYLTEQCCGGQPCGVGAAFNAVPVESPHPAG
jgi:ArsR family transcriptional regulator, arsenate/arsenite/antimonite-responsive transcriptional repressor